MRKWRKTRPLETMYDGTDIQDIEPIYMNTGDMLYVTYTDPKDKEWEVMSKPFEEPLVIERLAAWDMVNERGIKRGLGLGMGTRKYEDY
jgi:hypothetical protein